MTRPLHLRNFPAELRRRLEEIGEQLPGNGRRSAVSRGLEVALRAELVRRRRVPSEAPVYFAASIDAELLREVAETLRPGESLTSVARDAAEKV